VSDRGGKGIDLYGSRPLNVVVPMGSALAYYDVELGNRNDGGERVLTARSFHCIGENSVK
jgi:hypothetical protein